MSNINQNSILVNPYKKDQDILKKVEQKIEINQDVPNTYCEINLSSCGVLSSPSTLHFRDYEIDDLIDLNNHLYDEKYIEALIKVLNNMCYEYSIKQFNCKDLVEEEIIEILLYIHRRFHGDTLTNIPYLPDENKPDFIEYGHVNLADIKSNVIDSKFKEPFGFMNDKDKTEYYFILPRIGNVIYAKNFIEEKYQEIEKKYSNLKSLLKENQNIKNPLERFPINETELKDYEEIVEIKIKDMIRITTSLSIYGKKLSDGSVKKFSNEEKIEEYKNIEIETWKKFNTIKKKYSNFGINPVTNVFNEKDGKINSRRCLFQPIHFLSIDDISDDSTIDVSFGVPSENVEK